MGDVFPNGAVSLSVADGWRCSYEQGLPILDEAQLPSTHYIISGCLDDQQFPRYMNVDHLRDLTARGHEIGCHTASHKRLPTETQRIIEEEILLSRRYLERLVGSVETFSYPYGEYDQRIVAVVKRAGFLGARSVHDGLNDEGVDPVERVVGHARAHAAQRAVVHDPQEHRAVDRELLDFVEDRLALRDVALLRLLQE